MAERNRQHDEILDRFGTRAGFNGVGWGGCTCPCHRGIAVHIQACCHPSQEELQRILDVLADDGLAQKLVGAALAALVGGGASLSALANEALSRIEDVKRGGGGMPPIGREFPF